MKSSTAVAGSLNTAGVSPAATPAADRSVFAPQRISPDAAAVSTPESSPGRDVPGLEGELPNAFLLKRRSLDDCPNPGADQ